MAHIIRPSPTPATAATTVRMGRRAKPAFDLDNTLQTEPWTNVPVSVIHHSPTGFEWGYPGSGPSDLALNILNWFVPPEADGLEAVTCWKGRCSRTAWVLHLDFKEELIAPMARQADHQLDGEGILAWIAAHPFCKACGRVHGAEPDGICTCGHHWTGPCDCHWCIATREIEALETEELIEEAVDRIIARQAGLETEEE
jgi:hypothetical protein